MKRHNSEHPVHRQHAIKNKPKERSANNRHRSSSRRWRDTFFGGRGYRLWNTNTATNERGVCDIYRRSTHLRCLSTITITASAQLFYVSASRQPLLQTHQDCRSLLAVSVPEPCTGLQQEPKLPHEMPAGRCSQTRSGMLYIMHGQYKRQHRRRVETERKTKETKTLECGEGGKK